MLFLAVTLGFFVENQREHLIEHRREKQFIISMVKELEADTMQLHRVMRDSAKTQGLNDLADLIYAGNEMTINARGIYSLVVKNALAVTFMDFSGSTLSQLKNAGNMRLIRDRNAVYSFNKLDNKIKLMERQQNNVLEAIFNAQDYSTMIFNAKYFREGGRLRLPEKIRTDSVTPVLMTIDLQMLTAYANKILIETGRLSIYHNSLKSYGRFAATLISYLKKKYRIE